MEEQTDKAFIKNIIIVMILLIVITVAIIILARDTGYKDHEGDNQSRATTAIERIKPVGSVYTGEEGAAAIEQAVAVAAPAPEQAPATPEGQSRLIAERMRRFREQAAELPEGSPERAEIVDSQDEVFPVAPF